MAAIGGLFIDLGINTASFVTDINRINENLDSMQKKANVAMAKMVNGFNGGRDSLNKFGKEMFSAKGLMLQLTGAAGIGLLIKKSFDLAGQLVDTADSIGLTTTQLQEYQFAAGQSGVSTEGFNNAMTKFVKNVGEAQQAQGTLVSAFKDHNIQLLENIRHAATQDEAFRLVADAIKNAKTATEAATIATAAFGRDGVKMVNMLRDGSAGLDEFSQQAMKAGLVMDEGLIRAAEEAGDKLSLLADVGMKKVAIEVVQMAPQITNLTEKLIELVPPLLRVADVVVSVVSSAFEGWARIMEWTGVGLVKFEEKLGSISSQVAQEQLRLMGDSAKKSTEEVNGLNSALQKANKGGANASTNTSNPNASLPTIAQLDVNKKGKTDMEQKAKQIFDQTRTPVEEYNAKLKDLNKMLNAGAIDWDTYNRAMEQASTGLDSHIGIMENAKSIMDGFLDGSIRGWKDFGRVAVKALEDVLTNMSKMQSSGGGAGSTSGLLGGLFSAVAGSSSGGGSSFGGYFAEGGTLKRGQWGIAGENGPEPIFAGNGPMTVVPNGGGSGGSSRPINVNISVNTPNAQSFQRSQGQIAAEAAMAIRGATRNL